MAATGRVVFSVSLLVAGLTCIDAGGFLEMTRESQQIALADVEQSLLSELAGRTDTANLGGIENELRSMYMALPKNMAGNLEPATVRYALHRYFVQKHAWQMRGLGPGDEAWNSSTTHAMKDRVPAYIQGLLEERLHDRGLDLHELAVFAATLTDLVHQEASEALLRIFQELGMPTTGAISAFQRDVALKTYMGLKIVDLTDVPLSVVTPEGMRAFERAMVGVYPTWKETSMWADDLRLTADFQAQHRRNPFVPQRAETFDQVAGVLQTLGHEFGSFQNMECHPLKARLVEMEHQGTGRVRLSRFYADGLQKGDWTFTESVGYLRNLGVLDETDVDRPSVIIANYLSSQTNCLSTSGFYSVCCMDECEGLLQQVERAVAAPVASPYRLVEVVSAMHSDTVDAPRNLSAALLHRLEEVAKVHGGSVPLYGRLFAQWMHHAYPRECPFPHVTGTYNPMSPKEYAIANGNQSLDASAEVMRSHHASHDEDVALAQESRLFDLPWTFEEELLVERGVDASASSTRSLLRLLVILVALASLAAPMLRASKAMVAPCLGSELKCDKHLV